MNDELRAEGRPHRYAVLEPGSSSGSEMGLIGAFLGRDPDPTAFSGQSFLNFLRDDFVIEVQGTDKPDREMEAPGPGTASPSFSFSDTFPKMC